MANGPKKQKFWFAFLALCSILLRFVEFSFWDNKEILKNWDVLAGLSERW